MTDIRYVCLSDLHFGEEDSLLTNLKTASTETDPSEPSPVARGLAECLKALIFANKKEEKPTLILNGDVLEMALTTTNEAAMAFERFMELVMPPENELFENVVYVPGNHDHHLWELARETQYINHIRKLDPKKPLPIPWHTTETFMENPFATKRPRQVPSYFLSNLVKRSPKISSKIKDCEKDREKDCKITVSYPNYGLVSRDGKRCVVFYHGHFVEWPYHLMSHLKSLIFPNHEMPKSIDGIESENFAWIDFFWSMMGRSGEAGEHVEMIYEKVRDREGFKTLLYPLTDKLAEEINEEFDLPLVGEKMEEEILKRGLRFIVDMGVDLLSGPERARTDRLLSRDAERGIWRHVNGPLKDQIQRELGQMPQDVTLVFGHTHKPFEEDMDFSGFSQWVNVYNTGGWIVESVKPTPIRGGSVVLVDEDLNAASLRMYNEGNYSVRVEEATHADEEKNPFCHRIRELVKPNEDPWKSFSAATARAVRVREQHLRARINEEV